MSPSTRLQKRSDKMGAQSRGSCDPETSIPDMCNHAGVHTALMTAGYSVRRTVRAALAFSAAMNLSRMSSNKR
jgi:hypothetical protein